MMRSRLLFLPLFAMTSAGAQGRARQADPQIERYFQLARAEFSGDRAKDIVASMSGKQRWPGNTAFDAALDRVVAELRSAGYVHQDSAPASALLTYRVETRPLPGDAWDMIDASLSVDGHPRPLMSSTTNFNMLAVGSGSTPDTGVVAELIDIGRGTDYDRLSVAGKIVLVNGPAGRTLGEAVGQFNAVGVLAYNIPAYNKPEINRNIAQFTSIGGGPVLRDSVRRARGDTMQRPWAMSLTRAAYDSLRALLAKGPVRVRAIAHARSFPSVERTVIADVKGTVVPDERFVLSAHAQEPGANDNASGVGAQAEMARVLAVLSRNNTARPKRTITMIFGNEIWQTRNYLADDTVRARGVKWGLSLDMVGQDTRKTGGTFLIEKMPDPSAVWTRGADKHSEWGGSPVSKTRIVPHYFNDFLLDRALDQAATNGWVVNTNPYEGGSDHTPFLTAKIPGVLFWHFTDQFYHTDGDRIEMVSPVTLKNVGVTALVSALTLTSADGAMARKVVEQVEQAAIKRLDTELILSQKAIADGKRKADEVDILQTWTNYYVGAIDTMRDIEVGGSSAETILAIDNAKRRVRAGGAARIAKLP
jgi:hypothetical protein